MNKHLKNFLLRGLIFGGFGPIVAGVVYMIIDISDESLSLSGAEVLLAIISTYALAFIQAGASVFNQIEHWPIGKSMGLHFITLFLAYSGCYLINSWIPFRPMVLLIFAATFILGYLVIWLSVYLAVRHTKKRLNESLEG